MSVGDEKNTSLHKKSDDDGEIYIETTTDKVCKRRLEWLGHLARMPNYRIPKMTLFGWLPQLRPQGGPWRRWSDTIHRELKHLGIEEDKLYGIASTSIDLIGKLFITQQ